VMPEGFSFPSSTTQVWLPLRLDPTASDASERRGGNSSKPPEPLLRHEVEHASR